MRAIPAAISAFLFALLAMPALPVAAQCTLDVRQEHELASGLDAVRAKAGAAERGKAGMATDATAGLSADLATTDLATTDLATTDLAAADLAAAGLAASGSTADLVGVDPGQRETNGAGAPGLPLSRVAEAFAAHAASPLARSRPDPYRPYQARPPGAPPLKSDEVAANLRARGFVDVSAVRQRGRSFLAEATGPRGERVRLVLDADSGEINGMQVIGFRPATP